MAAPVFLWMLSKRQIREICYILRRAFYFVPGFLFRSEKRDSSAAEFIPITGERIRTTGYIVPFVIVILYESLETELIETILSL